MKYNANQRISVNSYFRRTYQQQEIDYIEEKNGKLSAFEYKYNAGQKAKIPSTFLEAYPESEFQVIHSKNFSSFVS
jgi:hypothetical protein